MFSNFLIIIPTFNESENINKIINELDEHGFHIIIIDDNSPDDTFNIVKNHKKFGQNLFGILRTSNRGYGVSVIEGFKYSIEHNYEYIVQMDSDFSHRVEDLLPMCNLAEEYDLIIGSRYINGGKIMGWGLFRRALSKYANKFAKKVTKSNVNDLTTGFRIYSKNLIQAINFQNIESNGYSFLVEIIAKIPDEKFKITEYPITFNDREFGKSKMSFKIIFESFINLLKIYFGK